MSLAGDLRTFILADATVTGLVVARMSPMRLPQNPTFPALVYTQISGPRDRNLSGPSGRVVARFQIDCWAKTYLQAQSLADAVRARLDGYQGTMGATVVGSVALENETDDLEEEPEEYRKIQDYMIAFCE